VTKKRGMLRYGHGANSLPELEWREAAHRHKGRRIRGHEGNRCAIAYSASPYEHP
jgi:hypothetical protein